MACVSSSSSRNHLTQRQWCTLIVFALADFCQAVCVSLQAPFYPQEAERKGVSPTAYGLVFGIFELTVFLVSPFFGRNLNYFGAKRVFNGGIFLTGTCSVIFGLLDNISSSDWFLALSLIIRALEAVGNAGFLTASFSIIAREFPDSVATMFACLETFFGIGLIVGPTLGGFLYQTGGFALPFVSMGLMLILAATFALFVLPNSYNQSDTSSDCEFSQKLTMTRALAVPRITLAAFSIVFASASIGFLITTLEPHLRQFNLSPIMIGVMFIINGGFYALGAPIVGIVCDNWITPNKCNVVGSICITVAFLLIGPSPILPMLTATLPLVILALVIHGIGIACVLVSSFAAAHKQAIAVGFSDNLDTYGVISALWTSTFALGAFVGPSVAGVLLEHYGFANATYFIFGFGLLMISCSFMFQLVKCCNRWQRERDDMYHVITDYDEVSYTDIRSSNNRLTQAQLDESLRLMTTNNKKDKKNKGRKLSDRSGYGSTMGDNVNRKERSPSLGYTTKSSSNSSSNNSIAGDDLLHQPLVPTSSKT